MEEEGALKAMKPEVEGEQRRLMPQKPSKVSVERKRLMEPNAAKRPVR